MNYFRRQRNQRLIPWLLACAVLLRSFIAPGYMLSVSAEDGLNIIFCNGLVSLVAQADHADHHAHHDGGEAQNEVHISPICSQWSTSSLLVFNSFPESVQFGVIHAGNEVTYNSPLTAQPFKRTRHIRGPPLLV